MQQAFNMSKSKIIGIVGGVGPYAGLDLNEKIFRLTEAHNDQEHLNVLLFSMGGRITDRTAYLTGEMPSSPANGMYEVLVKLEAAGAQVAGIPCNTSHAPVIWDDLIARLKKAGSKLDLVHMIAETALWIKSNYAGRNAGILGTSGTVQSDVYGKVFRAYDLNTVYPDPAVQTDMVHRAVYDPSWGIKAVSNPVSEPALENLLRAMDHLLDKKSEVIVLGCTEIPLAIRQNNYRGVPLIDATLLLARALIKKAAPDRLREDIFPLGKGG